MFEKYFKEKDKAKKEEIKNKIFKFFKDKNITEFGGVVRPRSFEDIKFGTQYYFIQYYDVYELNFNKETIIKKKKQYININEMF